jgi:hypothetical protein
MRISAPETIRCKAFANLLWLRLETDCGLVGPGEAFRNAEASEAYLHETLAPELLGRDPRPVAAHRERIGRVIADRFLGTPSRSVELRGDAAVDMALRDLLAQGLRVPLHRLWGGPVRERIRVYDIRAGPAYDTAPVVGWPSPGLRPWAPSTISKPGSTIPWASLAPGRGCDGPRDLAVRPLRRGDGRSARPSSRRPSPRSAPSATRSARPSRSSSSATVSGGCRRRYGSPVPSSPTGSSGSRTRSPCTGSTICGA